MGLIKDLFQRSVSLPDGGFVVQYDVGALSDPPPPDDQAAEPAVLMIPLAQPDFVLQYRSLQQACASAIKMPGNPHITIRYGLRCGVNQVRAAIGPYGDLEVQLGGLAVFRNQDADVLVILVGADQLRPLRSLVDQRLPADPAMFPQYRPHITIASFAPGSLGNDQVERLASRWEFEGERLLVRSLEYARGEVRYRIGLATGGILAGEAGPIEKGLSEDPAGDLIELAPILKRRADVMGVDLGGPEDSQDAIGIADLSGELQAVFKRDQNGSLMIETELPPEGVADLMLSHELEGLLVQKFGEQHYEIMLDRIAKDLSASDSMRGGTLVADASQPVGLETCPQCGRQEIEAKDGTIRGRHCKECGHEWDQETNHAAV